MGIIIESPSAQSTRSPTYHFTASACPLCWPFLLRGRPSTSRQGLCPPSKQPAVPPPQNKLWTPWPPAGMGNGHGHAPKPPRAPGDHASHPAQSPHSHTFLSEGQACAPPPHQRDICMTQGTGQKGFGDSGNIPVCFSKFTKSAMVLRLRRRVRDEKEGIREEQLKAGKI